MATVIQLTGKSMIFRSTRLFSLLLIAMLALTGCTQKPETKPEKDLEQLKLQSQMKALASEVVKLRESRMEVENLKATIAAMDSQVTRYQTTLEAKVVEPEVKLVATPRDPDIINLRGNIYVLIREIDSLKEGMKDLELLNDSLEMQIEQLAVATRTEPAMVKAMTAELPVKVEPEISQPEPAPVKETVQPVYIKEPVVSQPKKAQGYAYQTDYRMAYNDALNKYFNNEYLEAIQDFRLLIEREPQGAYADNAQYWIGECYYSMEDFESAITEFTKVFNFPENNKSDHALFKIAISYQQLGRDMKAREQMNRFILDYPESELVNQAHDFLRDNKRN